MAVLNPVSYLQARTDHTAQTDRLAESAYLQPDGAGNTWRGGVRGDLDLKVAAQGSPNMTVAVNPGQCFIPVSTALHGTYHLMNDGSMNVTITAAHASLPRNDLIIARVDDAFFTGAVNQGSIIVVTGTAAASPVDPTVLGSYILLARIVVTPAAAAITNAMITDLRKWSAALGGILPVANQTERDALSATFGRFVSRKDTGNIEFYNGTAWVVVHSGGWTAYTPTIVGTAAPTLDCRWQRVGDKLIVVEYNITLTNVVTANITMSLPSTPATVIRSNLGGCALYDNSSGNERHAYCRYSGGGIVNFALEPAGGIVAYAGVGVPWVWAAPDQLMGILYYREP